MQVRRLEAPFGAEILGLDLAQPLDAGTREAVNDAFVDNIVLVFRNQSFPTLDDFLAAARNLGEPMPPVTATYRLPEYDAIEELINSATDPRTGEEAPLMRGGAAGIPTIRTSPNRPRRPRSTPSICRPAAAAIPSSPRWSWRTRRCPPT